MQSSRRQMLKASAAVVGTLAIVPRHVLGGPKFVAPSEKINIAIVGAGGQGRTNARALFQNDDCQIISIADPVPYFSLERFYFKGVGGRDPVKKEIEEHYSKKTPNYKCAAYVEFREMLEKEKAIDAVLCATPDHLHAFVSVIAMKQGKHLYCEKPLTHNIWESRYVLKVAQETKVATQMGNMGHSTDGIRQTVEYLRDGAIGEVRDIHAWVHTSRWSEGLKGRPTETPPVPEGVNWDLWLGPRNQRPYHPCYVPVCWRDFWEFGCGALGDFACHDLDAAAWAYDLYEPESVEAFPAGYSDKEIVGYGEIAYFKFPAKGGKGGRPPVQITWYAGGLRPKHPELMRKGMTLKDRGVLFVGDKGILQCDGAGGAPRLFPDELRAAYKAPAASIKRVKGHHRDWLDAIKGGDAASSNFNEGAKLNELGLLGVLALRTRKRIEWDAANLKARGLPEADQYIKEGYRKGWELA